MLRGQIKELVSLQREQTKATQYKFDSLADQGDIVRSEQRKISSTFADMEHRYKEVMQENRLIRVELAEMRRVLPLRQ